MKKISTIILSLLFAAVFTLPIFASAATSPGVKPGSFFYFFDTSFEKIGLFFTFNPEKKARRALQYADERLAEIEVIAEEKDADAVKKAISNYENNVALAAEKSKEVTDKAKAENLLTVIEDNAAKNQDVLSVVLTKVPEEAREAILRAISASRKGQEEAAKQIAELKGEVEKLEQEVEELKKESNDPQADEVEKLKKEIYELKKQRLLQVPTLKQEELPPTQKPEPKQEENTWKYLVEGYASDAEWFRYNIELIKNDVDIPDMKSRRNSLARLLVNIRSTPFLSFSEEATFNEALDLYGDVVEVEISNIDKRLIAIEANLTSMDNYRAEYQRKVDSLLADPNKFRSTNDFVLYIQERDANKRFDGIRNINKIFQEHYQGVIDKIDQVQQITAILQREISKLSALTTVKVPSPQSIISNPAPWIPPQYPKTTNCTISGDGGVGLQAHINCTTY